MTAPYLAAWPDVDFDLTTAFRFGGIAALGSAGIHKSIHLGLRKGDEATDYVAGFLDLARTAR